jgi:hypothetical protein
MWSSILSARRRIGNRILADIAVIGWKMKTLLSFDQAVISLQNFLVEEMRPSKIRWGFREDLLSYKRQVFLRWPLPQENEFLAAKQYEIGREKSLGLSLEVLCFDEDHAFCHVLVPNDSYSSEALMMTELKLTYNTKPLRVVKIRSWWLWLVVTRFLARPSNFGWTDLIPLRKQT